MQRLQPKIPRQLYNMMVGRYVTLPFHILVHIPAFKIKATAEPVAQRQVEAVLVEGLSIGGRLITEL